MEISYDDFSKLELRIGLVKSAEDVEKSENLLKLKVDFKDEEKQIIAGIKKFYSPNDLIDKKFVFITNMETRKIMGLESQGMLLASEDEEGNIVILQPEKDIAPGSKIK